MEKSSKNSTLTNQWKIILAIFLIVVGGIFYWHSIRPSMIYSECHRLAVERAQEIYYESRTEWLEELEGLSTGEIREKIRREQIQIEKALERGGPIRLWNRYERFYNLSTEEIKKQIREIREEIKKEGYFNREYYEIFFKQCLRREGIIRD